MASSSKTTQGSKSPHPGLPPPGSNASILLEKARGGVRRSTPDSEALASSDDEVDQQQNNQNQAAPVQKPTRRTSWLNDVPPNLTRKTSLNAGTSFSSAGSNPTTPATEQKPWGSTTSPNLAGSVNWSTSASSPFAWGTGIWNSESRKEPPPRLTEVLQSPTTVNPPNSSGTPSDDIISPLARTVSGESAIPFAIPLHPTPKTYRSQSYSVGQLDPESSTMTPTKQPPPPPSAGRNRNSSQLASVQRRSSRPSLLGDLGHDPATLGLVREDDDDNTSPKDTDGGYGWSANQARTIEQLSLENALLRQAASGQLDSSRFRDRTLSSASANSGYSVAQGHNIHRIPGSVPEETDMAVEDKDELGEFPGYNNIHSNSRRRFSEHSANLEKQLAPFAGASLENRALENIKKAHWQTSLGFGGISEAPQSRRHSFADMPTRHASLGSSADSQLPISSGPSVNREDGYNNGYPEGALTAPPTEAASYFSPHDHTLRPNENIPSSGIPTSLHQAYVTPNTFGRQHSGLTQIHPNQQLFIVTFKCCRADVFYIQEDTGLQVKPGDLVIVEADRGTDLGTVAHANITWARARELKEHFAEEHYKWLMMFSRQNQGGPNAVGPNGPATSLNGAPGSAVGGMGPQSPHTAQEPQGGEIKPKLIKRLAQNHEIQTLRDKEGNEAKAKRVCQQKVVEHRLNMEILDAEFQMDWKKLTFYYFADAYINFNSLVTDLFKIYKTRIWMSAINPASFVTPSAGLPPPGAIGFGQDGHPDRRRPHEHRQYGNAYPESPGRENQSSGLRNPYMDPYQAFTTGGRPAELGLSGFAQSLQPQTDPFSSYPSTGFNPLDPTLADYNQGNAGRRGQVDWLNPHFQGLSLGS